MAQLGTFSCCCGHCSGDYAFIEQGNMLYADYRFKIWVNRESSYPRLLN